MLCFCGVIVVGVCSVLLCFGCVWLWLVFVFCWLGWWVFCCVWLLCRRGFFGVWWIVVWRWEWVWLGIWSFVICGWWWCRWVLVGWDWWSDRWWGGYWSWWWVFGFLCWCLRWCCCCCWRCFCCSCFWFVLFCCCGERFSWSVWWMVVLVLVGWVIFVVWGWECVSWVCFGLLGIVVGCFECGWDWSVWECVSWLFVWFCVVFF